jgi:hypothetical protein
MTLFLFPLDEDAFIPHWMTTVFVLLRTTTTGVHGASGEFAVGWGSRLGGGRAKGNPDPSLALDDIVLARPE